MKTEEVNSLVYVEYWETMPAGRRGTMDTRGLSDICDDNDGLPIEVTGYPPAHPNCRCRVQVRMEEVSQVKSKK